MHQTKSQPYESSNFCWRLLIVTSLYCKFPLHSLLGQHTHSWGPSKKEQYDETSLSVMCNNNQRRGNAWITQRGCFPTKFNRFVLDFAVYLFIYFFCFPIVWFGFVYCRYADPRPNTLKWIQLTLTFVAIRCRVVFYMRFYSDSDFFYLFSLFLFFYSFISSNVPTESNGVADLTTISATAEYGRWLLNARSSWRWCSVGINSLWNGQVSQWIPHIQKQQKKEEKKLEWTFLYT